MEYIQVVCPHFIVGEVIQHVGADDQALVSLPLELGERKLLIQR